MKAIKKTVDRMVVILPFEEDFYRSAGVPVTFVGHPLVDTISPRCGRDEFRAHHRVADGRPLVALLPGSREQEVRRIFPAMLGAARLLAARTGARFVAAASSPDRERQLRAASAAGPGEIDVVQGETYEAVAAADLAVVASGTATLECACLGTPMVVVYRVSPVSWWLACHLVRVPHVAMTNLIAGCRLVPELLQGEARPERIAEVSEDLLGSESHRQEMKSGLAEVRRSLGPSGAAGRAAEAVLAVAGHREAGP